MRVRKCLILIVFFNISTAIVNNDMHTPDENEHDLAIEDNQPVQELLSETDSDHGHLFNGTLNEILLSQNYHTLDDKDTLWDITMKNADWMRMGLTGYVLGNVLEILDNVTDITVPCKQSMLKFKSGIDIWLPWAVQMADSSAKVPAGLLDGAQVDFGNFEQCLSVRADSFQGQYCLVGHSSPLLSSTLRDKVHSYTARFGRPPEWIRYYLSEKSDLTENGTLWLGICMPSTCSEGDIKTLFGSVSSPFGLSVRLSDCQVDEDRKFSPSGYISLYGILTVICLSIIGTIFDVWINPAIDKKNSPNADGFLSRVLRAFSVVRRARKLQQDCSRTGSLDCLHGIRLISSTIMLLGHIYVYPDSWHLTRMSHFVRTDEIFKSIDRPFFENGGILLTNFFYISGLILTYSLWDKLEKNGGKISMLKFFLNKYLRVLPSFLLIVALTHVLPTLSRAPTWKSTWTEFSGNCDVYLWKNLLCISNFWSFKEQCLLHSWFLSALMQVQMAGVLLLLVTFRWRRAGIALGLLLTAVCCTYIFNLSMKNKFMPISPFIINDVQLIIFNGTTMYSNPFINFVLYAIGMTAGYIFLKHRNMVFSKESQVVFWMASFAALMLAFLGLSIVEPQGLGANLYNTLHRPLWCLGMTWVVYACHTGTGGIVNAVLSWRPMIWLSNLSFLCYLIHPLIHLHKTSSLKERVFFGHTEHMYDFVSIWVISFAVSYLFHLMVEAPFTEIQGMLVGSETSVRSKNDSSQTRGHEKTN